MRATPTSTVGSLPLRRSLCKAWDVTRVRLYRSFFTALAPFICEVASAERLTRTDFEYAWDIITPTPSTTYRIPFTDDNLQAFRAGVEVFDATDTAMTYRRYGGVVTPLAGGRENVVCISSDNNAPSSNWRCTTQSGAVPESGISIGVRTDGLEPSITVTVREGDSVLVTNAYEVTKKTATRFDLIDFPHIVPGTEFGFFRTVINFNDHRNRKSVDIQTSSPIQSIAGFFVQGPYISVVYDKHIHWRPAKLVGSSEGQIFTYLNPYTYPEWTVGRFTFATPVDPSLQLKDVNCKTGDCTPWSDNTHRLYEVYGITDQQPSYLVSLKDGPFNRLALNKSQASPPTLDVAYMEEGIIFYGQGKPPYTLVAQPKKETQKPFVQGQAAMFPLEEDEKSYQEASLRPYSSSERVGDEILKRTGPALLIVMVLLGFGWAIFPRWSKTSPLTSEHD
jgi:hypothetical protein